MLNRSNDAFLIETTIALSPLDDFLKRARLELTWPRLRLATARDETGALQHFQMFGNRGEAHLEWLGQLLDRGLPRGEAGQDHSPRWIGKGRENRAQPVLGWHLYQPCG